jgi:hypothetical protein
MRQIGADDPRNSAASVKAAGKFKIETRTDRTSVTDISSPMRL